MCRGVVRRVGSFAKNFIEEHAALSRVHCPDGNCSGLRVVCHIGLGTGRIQVESATISASVSSGIL